MSDNKISPIQIPAMGCVAGKAIHAHLSISMPITILVLGVLQQGPFIHISPSQCLSPSLSWVYCSKVHSSTSLHLYTYRVIVHGVVQQGPFIHISPSLCLSLSLTWVYYSNVRPSSSLHLFEYLSLLLVCAVAKSIHYHMSIRVPLLVIVVFCSNAL